MNCVWGFIIREPNIGASPVITAIPQTPVPDAPHARPMPHVPRGRPHFPVTRGIIKMAVVARHAPRPGQHRLGRSPRHHALSRRAPPVRMAPVGTVTSATVIGVVKKNRPDGRFFIMR